MEEQEVKDAPKVEVKDVGEINPDLTTPQQKEAAVLEKAVDEGKVDPEYGLQKDGVYKINVDKPPVPKKEAKSEPVKEVKEEPKKEEKDAIQESKTEGSVLRDERSEVGLQSVGSEVRETSQDSESVEKEKVESSQESTDSPLELITDEPKEQIKQEKKEEPVKEEKILQEEKQQKLPEGVEKLVQFMEETGGTLEDYAKLNRDYSKLDNVSLLQEYYEYTKPHLDKEDINFLMDKNFAYDEEADDPSDIKAKQLAFKEEVFKAQELLRTSKEKYYTDLKLRKQENIDPKYKEALEFYNTSKQYQEQANNAQEAFIKQTNTVFNEEFKGFDFKVGENKYRFKVDNPGKLKEFQSDISNFLNHYTNEDGTITNVRDYHKAIFAAQHADKLANHFYEQGRADAIKESAKKAKNINMDPRQESSTVTTNSGDRIRVVSGDSSDKLRIKWK